MRIHIIVTGFISWLTFTASASAADTATPATPAVSVTAAPSPAEAEISDTAARLELAKVLTYDKKYGEAAETYRQVLATEPENLQAKIGLSEVLYWTGNTEAAAAVLKDVPEDKLGDKEKLMFADLLVAKKEYEPALRIFSAYLDRNPNDWTVRLKLADVESWTKRYREAIASYEAILKARPHDKQVRRKYGMVLSWAGQNEKAAEQLRESLNE
jgi:thioredoxin-like negative regulator of GroEL